MTNTQPIQTITPLDPRPNSPPHHTLYKIVHPNGEWTVRNLTHNNGLYTGSFTPLPETFSTDIDAIAFERQRRAEQLMATMLA